MSQRDDAIADTPRIEPRAATTRGKSILTGLLPAGAFELPSWSNKASARRLRSRFLVSPAFDLVFFILSPLLALALGFALADSPLNRGDVYDGETWVELFISIFIMAHLFVTIFRSHCDREIFRLYPYRFTIVPIMLFLAMGVSPWVLVIGSVLATFWDVYHSGMQTFGIGRLYDKAAGNDAQVGRGLDIALNLFLYAGPIAAGATLMDHVNDFSEFERVGSFFFTEIPAYTEFNSGILSWLVIGTGVPFLFYYVYAYWKLSKQGYTISYQKVAMLVFTGACSIYAWGFNSFGMAFFIMNFFHAWQYFAIVWWSEKKNIVRISRQEGKPRATQMALMLLLVVGFGYGLVAGLYSGDSDWFISAFLVVSLTHFWFDGFIWSARRHQL